MTEFLLNKTKAVSGSQLLALRFHLFVARFRPNATAVQVLPFVCLLLAATSVFAQKDGSKVSESTTPDPLEAALRERVEAQRVTANAAPAVPFVRSMDALDDKQKLGVGDRISFRVLEDQEAAKLITVTDAGELDVPELGLVTAAGKSCKELALEIKSKLEETTYFKATVIVGVDLLNKTPSGRKVYVVGQVKVTGPQDIPAGETWTVSRAIMKAGGFTNFADKKKVRLVRGGATGKPGQTFFVNVSEIWENGRTDRDLPVQPEDLIYVGARAVNFY